MALAASAPRGHQQLVYGNVPCPGQVAGGSCLQVSSHSGKPRAGSRSLGCLGVGVGSGVVMASSG